jgi:hypothetical protein
MLRPMLVLALTSALIAAPTRTSDFTGAYELNTAASDNVENAIKAATSSMNFIVKPIARSRLKKVNRPHPTMFIQERGGTVSIAYNEQFPMVTPLDGTTVKWKNEEGETFDLSTTRTEGTLIQHFVAPDGERFNEFSQSAAGDTLYLGVTIKSPRLKTPLQYRLVYQRKRAAP